MDSSGSIQNIWDIPMSKQESKDHNRYNSNEIVTPFFEEHFGTVKQCIVRHFIWVFTICQWSHLGATDVSLGIPCILHKLIYFKAERLIDFINRLIPFGQMYIFPPNGLGNGLFIADEIIACR